MNIAVYLFDPKLPPTVEIKSNKFFIEWCKAKTRKVTLANHIILGHWMNQSEFETFHAGNACEQVTLASAFIAIWSKKQCAFFSFFLFVCLFQRSVGIAHSIVITFQDEYLIYRAQGDCKGHMVWKETWAMR